MIHGWADAGADGIFFCEDWGVQNRLLIHPDRWREVFKPLFARLVGAARSRGMHVLMHSCGYVWDIIDDLADVGVRCLQFDQPAIYGLDRLSDKLGARGVCLYSPVDIQQVMPTGDRGLIEGEAHRMIELFGGRFIAKNYGDLHGIGVQPEWDAWAYNVFTRAGGGALQAQDSPEAVA
jgi:uroporphyrinogen-III decarboxylase